jgi:uncharacterized protein (TIGR02266 family)
MAHDNRRYPRAPFRHRVWCEAQDATVYVRALNASERGLFIRTASPEPEGRNLRISFEHEGRRVAAKVQVAWSRPPANGAEPGMGVEIVDFEEGSDVYRELLERSRHDADRSVPPAPGEIR